MLFDRPIKAIFAFITILSISFAGCSNITAKSGIQSTSRSKASLCTPMKAHIPISAQDIFQCWKETGNLRLIISEKALLLDRYSERIIRHLATCYFQLGKMKGD